MQTCGYCGHENEDDARNCAECGTALAGEIRPPELAPAATEAPARVYLEEIDGAFTSHEGFSQPCWSVILRALRSYHAPEERLAAWTDVVSQWAGRWETELGHDYWLTRSGEFLLVSELDGDAAERFLRKANWLAEKIKGVLGPLAWEDRPVILIVHVADEFLARRFDEAVAPPEDENYTEWTSAKRTPFWTLICSQDEDVMIRDLESPLVWSSLEHLPLPYWLHWGIDTRIRRSIDSMRSGQARELFDPDLVSEHGRFWTEATIQSFWAGTCETEYPDQSKLAYDLSNILAQFVAEKAKNLVDYLRCAHYWDAGQSAAQACLDTELGELAATFLGPGHWSPDPQAIAECWDRVRKIKSDEE